MNLVIPRTLWRSGPLVWKLKKMVKGMIRFMELFPFPQRIAKNSSKCKFNWVTKNIYEFVCILEEILALFRYFPPPSPTDKIIIPPPPPPLVWDS